MTVAVKTTVIKFLKIMDNVLEWLNSEPLESELRIRDGAWYIPYHIIVEKLNKLTKGSWSGKKFIHVYQHVNKGKYIISGSVEVRVRYYVPDLIIEGRVSEYMKIKRTLPGAATFMINGASNPHVAATCKSLAIMNAVKPLGKTFGWGLNGFEREDEVPVAEVDTKIELPEDADAGLSKELSEVQFMLKAINNKEDAQAYINQTAFKHHAVVKEIINSKPNKTT